MADTLAQVQKDVQFWQRLLTFAGYKPGKIDGINSRKTKAATNNASPTTGWIAYHLLRDDFPDAEVVLVNFLPDGDNGSYKWHKHDWQYEADYYRKHEVPIKVLF